MSGSGHDVIVIGAGPNGLTAAAVLARGGRRVLVLERRDTLGGVGASEEFHPGYRSAGLLHDAGRLRPGVIGLLDLQRYGLVLRTRRPAVLGLGDGSGPGLLLHGDVGRAQDRIRHHSARDAEAYGQFRAFVDRVRGVVCDFTDRAPLDLLDTGLSGLAPPPALVGRALDLRRLGRKTMMELLRLPPMSVSDWLDEQFESDLLKATLALPALEAVHAGPRSPGTNANFLLHECMSGPGPVGGPAALIEALAHSAREFHVEIRTGAEVDRILTGAAGVRGVRLLDGEELAAPVVAATCDPKRCLLTLLEPDVLSLRFERRVSAYRMRGIVSRILLALDAPLTFRAAEGAPVEFARSATSLNDIERAFDAVKYGTIADEPALEIHVPSVARPELAPPGHSVVSVRVHFTPQSRRPPWDAAGRKQLGEHVVEILERHAPGVGSSIVAMDVATPDELETRYGLTGGHTHHGEHALDQLLIRPAPDCNGYRTPVPGLYLCGAGTHPGDGPSCGPGLLGAQAILGGTAAARLPHPVG